jgi:putative hemolysin
LLGRGDEPVTSVMWDIPAFPDAARVLTALREFQTRRTQMAVVVDEYGRTLGIVTVEDLVEELVGEIWDETDPDLQTIVREPDGTIVLPGTFPFHDLVDLDVELSDGDYTTIAGLVLDEMGRFPTVGESIDVDGWRITIRSIDRHRITLVALTPASPADDQRTVATNQ